MLIMKFLNWVLLKHIKFKTKNMMHFKVLIQKKIKNDKKNIYRNKK